MNDEDFHARLKELYHPPSNRFTLIDVPEIRYLAIDGKGNPKHTGIDDSMQWLWSIVSSLIPIARKRLGKKFAYPPLECLFWANDNEDFTSIEKDQWRWQVMVVVSSWATQDVIDTAVAQAEEKRGKKSPRTLHVTSLTEGRSVQIMHIGDYGKVQEVCEKLYKEFLPEQNLKPNGHYHEIYLNDPTRTAPEKRKVVVRQPIIKCGPS